MKRKPKKKRGPVPKPKSELVAKIKISITPARLAKVDRRGRNRSAAIGEMIDAAIEVEHPLLTKTKGFI
jgi:hypothetical protein